MRILVKYKERHPRRRRPPGAHTGRIVVKYWSNAGQICTAAGARTGQICTLQVRIRARKAGQMQSRHLSNTRSRDWSNTKGRQWSSTEPPQYKPEPSLVKSAAAAGQKRSRHACLTTSRLRGRGSGLPLLAAALGRFTGQKGRQKRSKRAPTEAAGRRGQTQPQEEKHSCRGPAPAFII